MSVPDPAAAGPADARFHHGELAVQGRAGVRREAARLAVMLAEPSLDGGKQRFLAAQTFAAITARDGDGLLWTSPLAAAPGFLDGHGTTLEVAAAPRPGDPLAGLPAGQQVGMIAIDFAGRRRFRVNGMLTHAARGRLRIAVDQAYGNCPQYIQQRRVEPGQPACAAPRRETPETTCLSVRQADTVRAADTFFLGTAHPTRGSDASHRGGPPGFVRADRGELWWPDYPGNNMFNSLGNIAANPAASVLFVTFTSGDTLHLTGTACLEWAAPGRPGDDGGTGRRVRFRPRRIVQPEEPLAIRSAAGRTYPYQKNPPLSD